MFFSLKRVKETITSAKNLTPSELLPTDFSTRRLLMITNGFEYHILNCLFIHKNPNYFSKNISTARGVPPCSVHFQTRNFKFQNQTKKHEPTNYQQQKTITRGFGPWKSLGAVRRWRAPEASEDADRHRVIIGKVAAGSRGSRRGSGGLRGFAAGPRVSGVRRLRHGQGECPPFK